MGSITGPMNVRHLNHISQDWKWAGDVSVFQMEEVLGKGYEKSKNGKDCWPACDVTFIANFCDRVSGTVYKAKVRDAGFDVAIKVVSQTNAKIQAELEKEIGNNFSLFYIYLYY